MDTTYSGELFEAAGGGGLLLILLLIAFVFGVIVGAVFFRYRREFSKPRAIPLPSPMSRGLPTLSAQTPTTHAIIQYDDLTVIEGIGERVQDLLYINGITSHALLARTPADRLERILKRADDRFALHDPSEWPTQAALARDARWDELEEYKKELL